jgi:toxin FitB
MILLDTNVLSGVMRPDSNAAVVSWLDRQPRISVWVTSITVMEIRFGIALLPPGRRRSHLERGYERTMAEKIADRVVPFDASAAEAAADLMAKRRQRGRPVELRDTMIAGIAISRHATLATRNIRDFADLAVSVVDPWAA